MSSLTSYIRRSIARKPAEPLDEKEVVKKPVVGWTDVTASTVINDTLILGFGNGALSCLDTKARVAKEESLSHLELNFTGEEDHYVEKLRTMAIDGLFQHEDIGIKKT